MARLQKLRKIRSFNLNEKVQKSSLDAMREVLKALAFIGILPTSCTASNRGDSMDEQRFWDIIESACQGPWIGEDDFPWADAVRADLKKFNPAEIVRFQFWFDQKIHALYTWDHWGAMRLVSGYESDASFFRFICWLVGKGKKIYEAVLENPDNLADFAESLSPDGEYANNLLAVGLHAWQNLGLPDADFRSAYAALGKRERPEITGEEWPCDIPDTMLKERYPRLSKAVGLQ
jgi:hypothetical protein